MRTLAMAVLYAGILAATEPKDSYAFRMRSLLLAEEQVKDTNMFTVRSFQACDSPCAIPLRQFSKDNAARRDNETFSFKKERRESTPTPHLCVLPPPLCGHDKVFFFKPDSASPAAPAKNQ